MNIKILETLSLIYKDSKISYRRFGDGDKILLCLHGYGEDAGSFLFLEKILGKEYDFITLDLPFHGSTDWKEGLLCTGDDLMNIIDQIVGNSSKSFAIIGYSMGGRVALQLLQANPDRIQKLMLIAPDGLHHNIWHQLSTQTAIGNKLFLYTMNRPYWMFGLMKLLTATKIFNKSIVNFVHYYLDDPDSRQLLYKRWTTMRKFNPNQCLLKKIIVEKKIRICMLFGKYDRVILTKRGLKFRKKLEAFITIKELEAGHQLLRPKYADDIAILIRG